MKAEGIPLEAEALSFFAGIMEGKYQRHEEYYQ